MKSMTGFGCGEYENENISIDIEIKTINHRYKDFNIRMPRKYSSFEEGIRDKISKKISRGRVDIFINVEHHAKENLSLKYNECLARSYYKILDQINKDFKNIEHDITTTTIARFGDVVEIAEEDEDIKKTLEFFMQALELALIRLLQSRKKEGAEIKKDFKKRIKTIKNEMACITALSDKLPQEYAASLEQNIENYNIGVIDKDRLATEIALHADRVNITEELVRLKSHLKSFETIIELREPIGRKLDFLMQEINREANTIASKSNNFDISSHVVEVKSELEKIREQVQNIE